MTKAEKNKVDELNRRLADAEKRAKDLHKVLGVVIAFPFTPARWREHAQAEHERLKP